MEVCDFDGTYEVSSEEQLDAVLSRRHTIDGAQVNSFWMGHDQPFPLFSLLVRDDLAYAWYSPRDGHPGFVPIGTARALDQDATTVFFLDTQPEPVPNYQIVSFVEAREAAREFFRTNALPACLKWVEMWQESP